MGVTDSATGVLIADTATGSRFVTAVVAGELESEVAEVIALSHVRDDDHTRLGAADSSAPRPPETVVFPLQGSVIYLLTLT